MAFADCKSETDFVKIEMENGDIIVLELFDSSAPETVKNFKKLVLENFYDGLIFHRVIKGFMIQGGDPSGTGYGGSKICIKGEFAANGFDNGISHKRGVVSMARSQMYNSASSQFFICHENAIFLDGQYASFGSVISGMDVVDKIACVKVDSSDKPFNRQVMKKVSFVTEI